jgi:hypothetical protein
MHRSVLPSKSSYTLVEDVVIYYVRLRDLNSHEEWTFKTRYSELRNVHDALEESHIKNLYSSYHLGLLSLRRRFLELLTKALRILIGEDNNCRSISMKSLTRSKYCVVTQSDTSSKNQRSKRNGTSSCRLFVRRRMKSHDLILPIAHSSLVQ